MLLGATLFLSTLFRLVLFKFLILTLMVETLLYLLLMFSQLLKLLLLLLKVCLTIRDPSLEFDFEIMLALSLLADDAGFLL